MKNYALILGGLAVLAIVALWMVNVRPVQAPGDGKACTQEAKICPDGSAVGRTGPNCEFAPCPESTATTTTTSSSAVSIGKNTTVNGTTIIVRSLVEDSRCPADVQCIQAGTVRVSASVDAYSNDFTFTLDKPQVVGNKIITLTTVTPTQKIAKQSLQLSDYRFTFSAVLKTGGIPGGTVCTMDVKACPDGSYVSRSGPTCAFAPCPTGNTSMSYKSGVRGSVSLGPTCPVMRNPPDPQCADKPYATSIVVTRSGASTPFVIGNANADGTFQISLPPGSYTLTAGDGKMLPRCSPVTVTVDASGYTGVAISCDSGIR